MHKQNRIAKILTLFWILILFAIQPVHSQSAQSNGSAEDSTQQTEQESAASAIQMLQNPFFGSVPAGQISEQPLQLSLSDAVKRGLQQNLGVLLRQQSIEAARGNRWTHLSDLLPDIRGGSFATREKVSLAAFGFSGFPGFPEIIGPFSVVDARLFVTQSVVDFEDIFDTKAASKQESAARYSYRDARDVVVLICSNLYLQTVAASNRIQAAEAQLKTAEALHRLALDQNKSGIIPGIDVLRAQVEMQSQQQRLTSFRNDFEKAKLTLARAIGIPLGQQFSLTDPLPSTPVPPITLEAALGMAFQSRSDYKSATELVRAAEDVKKSARAGAFPSLDVDADYGTIGQSVSSTKSTFRVAANVTIPIFRGGEVHGRVLQADALLKQRAAERAELQSRIEYEVRTAFLDLQSSGQNLKVASNTLELAQQQLNQAQDRFSAGVTNNIEVIQAQESVSISNENYISSLYTFNAAKGTLARALGVAEEAFRKFILGAEY